MRSRMYGGAGSGRITGAAGFAGIGAADWIAADALTDAAATSTKPNPTRFQADVMASSFPPTLSFIAAA